VEGLPGLGCEQLTERIESKLGTVQLRRSTSEAFQSLPQTAASALPLEQRST
jgi:hypothetical protein